jgi:chromosome segregation ATPase
MTPRRFLKDPKWAKLREEIYATDLAAARAYQRLSRAWHRHAKLMQQLRRLERRLVRREGELDAAEAAEKGAAP